ncbi:MAG: response regulator [Pyrinomonadaceae bacterium]
MKLEIELAPQIFFNQNQSPEKNSAEEITAMLDSGIQAAKNGNRAAARKQLLRVTEIESENETAWLWLASISEYPEELLAFLRRVLEINPRSERALEWSAATKSLLADNFVQRGIDARQENRLESACRCFLQAVANDSQNETARLELAFLAETPEEKIAYLEQVLNINPANETALSALESVKQEALQSLLKNANSAAISGEREIALQLLEEAEQSAPDIEEIWMLRAYLADKSQEKIECYEKVLQLNPANEAAQAGLFSIQAAIEKIDGQKSFAEALKDAFEAQDFSNGDAQSEGFSETNPAEQPAAVEEQAENFSEPDDFTGVEISESSDETNFAEHYEIDADNLEFDEEFPTGENVLFVSAGDEEMIFDADEETVFEMNDSAPQKNVETDVFLQTESNESENKVFDDAQLCAAETKIAETPAVSPLESHSGILLKQSVKPFACPFCYATNEPQAIICNSCRTMLSLADLEMLLAYQAAHLEVLHSAIENMETARAGRELSVEELSHLAIAYLNAKNLRAGLTCLQEAARQNPNDIGLISKINFLAIRLAEIEEQNSKSAKNQIRKCTIMIVDDNPTIRKLVSGKLEKCGHTVIPAIDGRDALTKINEAAPDLILLDIAMPEMDGYQVCQIIRSSEETKDVPVLLISGKDGVFDESRGQTVGSNGFIAKPFGPETLMRTIENYLI